jgi:hypothetical protein
MSLLFTVENKLVRPHTETLLLYPFNEIWERDSSEDKRYAIEDFCFIEFMVSVKKSNPYSGYTTSDRREKILKDIITRAEWEEDSLIKVGMSRLEDFQREASITYNYFMAAKIAAEKMQRFFIDFDMTLVNERTGNPVYKPKDITSALNDTSRVLENLSGLKEKVDNEIFEEVKNKGQKIVSPFADPGSLK